MNSLSYLSRQFDVLAAARTVPNTPSSEHPPPPPPPLPSTAADFDQVHLHSLSSSSTTWSIKSLVAPPSPPRRTLSSPAIIGRWKRSTTPPSTAATPPLTPPTPPSPTLSTSSSSSSSSALSIKATTTRRSSQRRRSALRAKSSSQPPGLARRMFLVRVLVLVWHAVCATAHSLSTALSLRWLWPSRAHDPAVSAAVKRALAVSASVASETPPPSGEKRSTPTTPTPSPPDPSPTPPIVTHPPAPIRLPTDPALPSTVATTVATGHFPLAPAFAPDSTPTDIRVSRTPSPNFAAGATGSGLPIPPRRTPFHLPKTLVLDLDETLIHSTSRPLPSYGGGLLGVSFGRRDRASHKVEVTLGGKSTTYHVYKRPFADFFLRKVSAWYTLVIFTASMQEYADPVIDWLDAGTGILSRRLFRESCTLLPNGTYSKDLSVVEQDLSRVALIDNSPVSYSVNETNGIPIEGWTHDPYDEALLDLLPVLDSLRFTSDVRRVLGLRGFIV